MTLTPALPVALENLPPRRPACDFHELREVVDKMGSEWLGVCFDTGHAHTAGGVKEGMEVLKDLIINFHLTDNDSTRDMHLQPPYGSIPWDDFLAVFGTMSFQDPIPVEAAPWQGAGYGQQRREMEALLEGRLLKADVAGTMTKVQCLRCGHMRFGTLEDNWCACRET